MAVTMAVPMRELVGKSIGRKMQLCMDPRASKWIAHSRAMACAC